MTQEQALNILKSGDNVFLTGAAGSGKTYVLNQYISYLRSHGVAVAVTASTGIAATHLNGTTIHSWSGMGINDTLTDQEIKGLSRNARTAKRISTPAVLIIDEVSMLDASRLQLVNRITRYFRSSFAPFGGLQVVVSGDFFQLPPVYKGQGEEGKMAFQGTGWQDLAPTICYLSEQHRQEDDAYLAVLNAIRDNAVDEGTYALLEERFQAEIPHAKPARLFPHNFNVDSKNDKELDQLAGKTEVFEMTSSGNKKVSQALIKSCLAPERLVVKKEAVVMFVKNNFERKVVNGTMGIIEDFDSATGYPVVRLKDGRRVVAIPDSWHVQDDSGKILAQITQIPLRLAWAITIHKSQGMSLDAAEIDLSRAFSPGMGYVALSRVRSLSGLRLLGFNNTALQVHDLVSQVDAGFKELSAIKAREVEAKDKGLLKSEHEKFLKNSGGQLAPKKEKFEEKNKKEKSTYLTDIRKKYSNAYTPWKEGDDELLTTMFQSGIAREKIGEFFKRQPGSITMRLKKLGLIEE